VKTIADFLKTTVLGGLFILLPLLLLELMLIELFELMVVLAAPIADFFPKAWIEAFSAPALLAVALILLASFVLGMIAKSATGQRVGRWLERNTVGRIPLYGVLKGLAARMVEIGEGGTFRPALMVSSDGQREFAYLIEEHGDGYATVMVPRAPTPLAGNVKIVSMKQVETLDASLGDLTEVLSHWGVGGRELIRRSRR